MNFKIIARYLILLCAFAGSTAFAQSNCGVVPEKPEIVDGSTANMDELVANSQEVKNYIAEVDAFLDCYDAFMQTDTFAQLSQSEQLVYADAMEAILAARNAIGPEFNEQVQAYQEANPQ